MFKNKDILSKLKIEPQYSKGLSVQHKIVGIRGVRDGLGATTFLNHLAVALGIRGSNVCVVDLDFAMPNYALTSSKVYSIAAKLNRQQENIMNIINSTDYTSVSYVGPSLNETIMDYMPTILDETYINSRSQVFEIMFEELSKKFDLILVDMPSDIRQPESIMSLCLCSKVYTLCKVNPHYIGKLQRESAILTSMSSIKSGVNIINVYDRIESRDIYKAAIQDSVLITEIAHSAEIAEACLNGKIRHIRKRDACESLDEMMYYAGIQEVIEDLKGGLTND